jgi:hypothetical protein
MCLGALQGATLRGQAEAAGDASTCEPWQRVPASWRAGGAAVRRALLLQLAATLLGTDRPAEQPWPEAPLVPAAIT